MSINDEGRATEEYQQYLEKIRDVQHAKGYDNHRMAAELGLGDQTSWSKIVNGKTLLTLPLLLAIAKVFEMSLPQLLNYDRANYFSYCTGNHVLGSHNTYNAANEKERELWETLVSELRGQNAELKVEVAELRKDKELLRAELQEARAGKRR